MPAQKVWMDSVKPSDMSTATIVHSNVTIEGEDVRLEVFSFIGTEHAFDKMEKVLKRHGLLRGESEGTLTDADGYAIMDRVCIHLAEKLLDDAPNAEREIRWDAYHKANNIRLDLRNDVIMESMGC